MKSVFSTMKSVFSTIKSVFSTMKSVFPAMKSGSAKMNMQLRYFYFGFFIPDNKVEICLKNVILQEKLLSWQYYEIDFLRKFQNTMTDKKTQIS